MSLIKGLVDQLIHKYKTNDPFNIAKERNIQLVFEDLEDIYGYYFHYKRVQFININNKLSSTLQRFVCAHELGHAVQHPQQNTAYLSKYTLFSTDKFEIEANTFAVELLTDDLEISEYIRRGYTLDQIARIYGIPSQWMNLKTFL